MARKLHGPRKGNDAEPLSPRAQPYRRPTRPGVNPTPPAVTAALVGTHDLGAAGRALKQAFPEWTEQQRLDVLREYVRNLQFKWLGSPERRVREGIARGHGVPFVTPGGGLDGERLAAELSEAEAEVAELEHDNLVLEGKVDELEDRVEELKRRSAPTQTRPQPRRAAENTGCSDDDTGPRPA